MRPIEPARSYIFHLRPIVDEGVIKDNITLRSGSEMYADIALRKYIADKTVLVGVVNENTFIAPASDNISFDLCLIGKVEQQTAIAVIF